MVRSMKSYPIAIPALFSLGLLYLPGEAEAQITRSIQRLHEPAKRALVIGNDEYKSTPLRNAVNDASEISRLLEELGFEVREHFDVEQREFDYAVDEFISDLGYDDTAVFFYAGHGVQIDGLNYLIPVDFEASDVREVKYRSYPADLVRERMEAAGTALNILILDACRDNPFRGTRSFGGGLAQMETGVGTFIAFSTSPGRTAADTPSRPNSLFTDHLIDALKVPGLSLDEIFNEVRRKVYRESAGRQIPWTSSSLIGEFHFRPSTPSQPETIENGGSGELAIQVNVDEAVVLLDGQRADVRQGSAGVLHLPSVPAGARRVTIRKDGYAEEQRFIEVRRGETNRMSVVLMPIGRTSPPSASRKTSYTRDSQDTFCQVLEQVLEACPKDFRPLVDSAALAEARTFLQPAITFPDAWYSRVFRADAGQHRYLASFQIAPGADPENKMAGYATRIKSCLLPEVVNNQRRGSRSHQIEVEAQSGLCQIGIAVNGRDVDLTISGPQR